MEQSSYGVLIGAKVALADRLRRRPLQKLEAKKKPRPQITRTGHPKTLSGDGAWTNRLGHLFAEFAGGGDAFGFGDDDGLAGGDILQMIDLAAGPADFDAVGVVVLGQAEGKNQFAGG
jgi:hypothetical protein